MCKSEASIDSWVEPTDLINPLRLARAFWRHHAVSRSGPSCWSLAVIVRSGLLIQNVETLTEQFGCGLERCGR
jgi:hypothetical protein